MYTNFETNTLKEEATWNMYCVIMKIILNWILGEYVAKA
jgi:hypothetical protein